MTAKQRVHWDLLEYEWEGSYLLNDEPYNGTAYTTNKAGEMVEEMEYVDGWETHYKQWYLSGQLREETEFKPNDIWHWEWHENGQMALEKRNEGGAISQRKRWDDSGNLIEDFVIKPGDDYYAIFLLASQRKAAREEAASGIVQDDSSPEG